MANCSRCGQKGATRIYGEYTYHEECYLKTPANVIFPPEFRKPKTSEQNLRELVAKQTKDGNFKL